MPELGELRLVLMDFDDTLAAGPLTWGTEKFLPSVMARHGLTPDQARLDAAVVTALEKSAAHVEDDEVLTGFLADMGWPQELRADLAVGMEAEFAFSLFDDTVAFLRRLRKRGAKVFVVSNNNRSPQLAKKLGIAKHFAGFLTPAMQESLLPKPDRSMFDALRTRLPDLDPARTILIGDDPWADAPFAAASGLRCLLVDRARRYRALTLPDHVTFVDSLAALR
jgi:FMN phosphatase YigB (HAD superfamily)